MTSGRRALRTSVCVLSAMVFTASLLALGSLGSVGAAGAADAPAVVAWEQWQHVPGVIDLAGPRRDGQLVATANGRLVLIDPATGRVTAFAPAYSVATGPESYIAMSPGLAVDGAHCRFRRDDVFALDPSAPPGVKRIAARGTVTKLATIPGVTTLTGIAFDTVGRFGHRLLVMGLSEPGQTRVSAVDCRGKVTSIGVVDIALEGGMAVAPRDFGLFGGQLFAASEDTGEIFAISPSGLLSAVAPSGVEAGPDVGVQGVGFVPAKGAPTAFIADRGGQTPPHAGTDSVLRLDTAALAARVQPGDLLAATEGGATVVDVRCSDRCTVTRIATGPSIAHGEGHVLILAAAR